MIEAGFMGHKVYVAGGSKWDLKYATCFCVVLCSCDLGVTPMGHTGSPRKTVSSCLRCVGSYLTFLDDLGATIVEFSLREPYDIDRTNLSALFTKNSDQTYQSVSFESGKMFTNYDDLVLYGFVTRNSSSGPLTNLGQRTISADR